jgi:hypothetical protein
MIIRGRIKGDRIRARIAVLPRSRRRTSTKAAGVAMSVASAAVRRATEKDRMLAPIQRFDAK